MGIAKVAFNAGAKSDELLIRVFVSQGALISEELRKTILANAGALLSGGGRPIDRSNGHPRGAFLGRA